MRARGVKGREGEMRGKQGDMGTGSVKGASCSERL